MTPTNALSIIDPTTTQPFPSQIVGGRLCVAVSSGKPFAIRVAGHNQREEVVLAVDGRDTLTNRPADPSASGLIFTSAYVCKGFRISETEVREFVAAQIGHGLTTAERNDSAQCCGLIAAVVYSEGRAYRPAHLESLNASPLRSGGGGLEGLSRGSVGAAAGQSVESRVSTTAWTRGQELWRAVIEYDTREGWAARGVIIPGLSMANPWPGEQRFAATESL